MFQQWPIGEVMALGRWAVILCSCANGAAMMRGLQGAMPQREIWVDYL